ncbi:hypothetical protein SD78_0206 [Bacillus badius]|nr:hypothetical protein SD78_0206 [Bacillus badius]
MVIINKTIESAVVLSLAMFNQPDDCHSFCCIDAEEMLRAFSRPYWH